LPLSMPPPARTLLALSEKGENPLRPSSTSLGPPAPPPAIRSLAMALRVLDDASPPLAALLVALVELLLLVVVALVLAKAVELLAKG
jgi:hypothetical protein